MNRYLLLRDNRQSGPYTVAELAEKGLKPYDLVWLDGKSAAWRYPSELEDLKAYAPVTEEQPFDRFYKRPAAVQAIADQYAETPHALAAAKARAEYQRQEDLRAYAKEAEAIRLKSGENLRYSASPEQPPADHLKFVPRAEAVKVNMNQELEPKDNFVPKVAAQQSGAAPTLRGAVQATAAKAEMALLVDAPPKKVYVNFPAARSKPSVGLRDNLGTSTATSVAVGDNPGIRGAGSIAIPERDAERNARSVADLNRAAGEEWAFAGGTEAGAMANETPGVFYATTPSSQPFTNQPLREPLVSTHDYVRLRARRSPSFYLAAAACLLLVGMVTYVIIGSISQRRSINELNNMMQQLESKSRARTAPEAQTASEVKTAAGIQTAATLLTAPRGSKPPTPAGQNPSAGNANAQRLDAGKNGTDYSQVTAASNAAANNSHAKESGVPEAKSENARPVLRRTSANGDEPASRGGQYTIRNQELSGSTDRDQRYNIRNQQIPAEDGGRTGNRVNLNENLFKLVSVRSNDYKTGVLGGISNLQLELTNSSSRDLQKVAVIVKYFGPEKKIVRTQTVYFEDIPAGTTRKLDVPKTNRGVSVDYEIVDIRS